VTRFEHVRHRPPTLLERPRELVLAVPKLQSNVNLARIVRVAGCCGLTRILVEGKPRIDPTIARDSLEQITIEPHRTLLPVLRRWRDEGVPLIGLEQADNAISLHEFTIPRKGLLVVGHERHGLAGERLALMDFVVEIPVYGRPFSYNVATATTMFLYEYCRQYPRG
jgi:tRNA G18 (ribose-2'-O)-methylase SpoU